MQKLGFVGAVFLMVAVLVGCGGKKGEDKKAPEESAETGDRAEGEPECTVDDDCYPTEVCLGGQCASTAHGGVYSNPRRAVTPAKVKGEVEKRMQDGQDRRDQRLDELDK